MQRVPPSTQMQEVLRNARMKPEGLAMELMPTIHYTMLCRSDVPKITSRCYGGFHLTCGPTPDRVYTDAGA
jgi:hypothetical protein